MEGRWGPVTASKDWCEPNYLFSPWIAEWWSTWSCAALAGAALVGLWETRRREARFSVAFLLLLGVGVGSALFHATLLRETQLLDQLPMWALVVFLTWVIVQVDPRHQAGPWFPVGLGVVGIGVPVAYVLARGRLQFLTFHVTFASLEIFCLARVGWLAARAGLGGRYLAALALYVAAVGAWFVDLLLCEPLTEGLQARGLPRIEWHALWHVGVAGGFLGMMRLLVELRARFGGSSLGTEQPPATLP